MSKEGEAISHGQPVNVPELKDCDLSPTKSLAFGHFFYRQMFDNFREDVFIPTHITGRTKDALIKQYQQDENLDKRPAELYVEQYAKYFGLDTQLMKRWVNAASIELATANLLALRASDCPTPARILQAVQRIADQGIQAPVGDHKLCDYSMSNDDPEPIFIYEVKRGRRRHQSLDGRDDEQEIDY